MGAAGGIIDSRCRCPYTWKSSGEEQMRGFLPSTVLALACAAIGCAAAVKAEQRDDLTDEYYVQRMLALRKALHDNPGDSDYLAQVRSAERQISTHFLAAGRKLLDAKDYAQSIRKFEIGLVVEPSNAALQEARVTALKRKEVARLYAEEQRAKVIGNMELARSLIEKARMIDAKDENLRKEASRLDGERRSKGERLLVRALSTPEPIQVNFRDARLKDALTSISDTIGLNYVFDPSVEDVPVSLSARNVSFKQAFAMILQSGGATYKPLGTNSVLIYQNTPEKRAKYADMYFKIFHLYATKADKMAELLKTQMDLKTVTVNAELNTVQVRESPETLEVIDKLIASLDRTPAEIMLDVEILEINRSKAEQLGFDYGNQISVSFPGSTPSPTTNGNVTPGIPARQFVNGQFLRDVLGGASVNLPSLTLKYMQNEVGGRVLAKPSIRTLDGRPAKIHIGDRVPLRSSTVQDVTGQTRSMYEYRDIGIKLEVVPKYHLDDTVTVELNMEVSALGNNVGTAAEPAYAIGTRNINTTMLLREGESALLGGLIRDEERRAMNKVPGLADIGVLGRLFANNDDADNRTDLVLTMTPKIIREQALPEPGGSSFFSGKNGNFTADSSFDYMKEPPATPEGPRFKIPPARNGEGAPVAQEGPAWSTALQPVSAEPGSAKPTAP
jgi:general secretion pathway protein D